MCRKKCLEFRKCIFSPAVKKKKMDTTETSTRQRPFCNLCYLEYIHAFLLFVSKDGPFVGVERFDAWEKHR